MGYRLLADVLVLVHAAFVVFVVLGAFLALWRRWVIWLHFPAFLWGALIEFFGWVCPLTPWEQALRASAGQDGYSGGFIDHYLVPLIYPASLTRRGQLMLGILVVALNGAAYAIILPRLRRNRAPRPGV
jgi:hypothetical protein